MGTQTATFVQRVQQVRRQTIGTTPAILRTFLFSTWALSLATYLVLVLSAGQTRQAIQTVKQDATVSMVAAQQIRAGLANMHSEAANALLAEPISRDAEGYISPFDRQAEALAAPKTDAAHNITYESEEKQIRDLDKEFVHYYKLMGQADLLHQQGKPSEAVARYWQADELVRKQLMPAATRLYEINRDELDRRYEQDGKTAGSMRLAMVLAELIALGLLVGTQVFLFRRMHRILNPLLLGASVLVVGLLLYSLVAFDIASSALKTAKVDAFDSRDVLWQARADAYDANGDESRWLLDPAHRDFYERAFQEKVQKLVQVPKGQTYPELVAAVEKTAPGFLSMPSNFTRKNGYLGLELNNISFPGEGKEALETLKAFGRYLEIDHRIRQLEREGKHTEAVALCLGKKEGQSDWAFAQFDEALGRTLKINDQAFHAAVGGKDENGKESDGRAQHALAGFEGISAAVLLLVCVLTFAGLRPRMQEYAL